SVDMPDQFGAAERIADRRGITREDLDALGVRSQNLAKQAWDEGRFDREIIPVTAPVLDADRNPTGETATITRDHGLRDTTLEGLAKLDPVMEGARRPAGSSSQLAAGASPVRWLRA